MKMRTKTEIIVETRSILTLKRSGRFELAWCDRCNKPSQMLSADEAALLCRISSRADYLRIEANELHFTETTDGLLLICANSLERGDKRQ